MFYCSLSERPKRPECYHQAYHCFNSYINKTKKITTFGIDPKYNRKIVENHRNRNKIENNSRYIPDHSQ